MNSFIGLVRKDPILSHPDGNLVWFNLCRFFFLATLSSISICALHTIFSFLFFSEFCRVKIGGCLCGSSLQLPFFPSPKYSFLDFYSHYIYLPFPFLSFFFFPIFSCFQSIHPWFCMSVNKIDLFNSCNKWRTI